MAHRIISQLVFVGTRVVTRAFTEAYKQAQASSKYAAATGTTGQGFSARGGMTLDEACKVLDVAPPKGGQIDTEVVMARFKRLFDQNETQNGGSLYIQSKVLRARERIELEVRTKGQSSEREAELKEGWKPKVFKE